MGKHEQKTEIMWKSNKGDRKEKIEQVEENGKGSRRKRNVTEATSKTFIGQAGLD